MSFKAQAWAVEQRAGGSSAKLVLMIYASFANEHHEAYPSNATLSEMTELDPKTVRAAVDQLVACGLLIDTGKRAGATRQVRVYKLTVERQPVPVAFGVGERSDTSSVAQEGPAEASRERPPEADALKTTNFPAKGTQKRVAEPIREPIPPEEASASSTPKGVRKGRGFRIPDDWAPPPIDQLPPSAAVIARQWPAGAYAVHADAFRLYWSGEGRAGARKHDWGEAWAHRVITLGARPVLDARAGISFDAAPVRASPRPPKAAGEAARRSVVLAALRGAEGDGEQRLRDAMRQEIGSRLYDQWLKPCALAIGDALVVTAPSSFVRAWVEQHYTVKLAASVVDVVGLSLAVEIRPPPGAIADGDA